MTRAAAQVEPAATADGVEFSIHGVVGVRVVNPSPYDQAALTKRFGRHRGVLTREPDVTVRFVKRLAPVDLQFLGLNSAGFTKHDDGFYLLDPRNGHLQARVPFEQIGGPCEILCQNGVGVPLLDDIINLAFFQKGFLPIHAAAFEFRGKGILVTGWVKGGKTEAMLSFVNHDAIYVGDEWVLLSTDGRSMYGLPSPITVWDWQFSEIKRLSFPAQRSKRAIFKVIHAIDAIGSAICRSRLGRLSVFRMLSWALPALRRRLHIRELPQTLFGDRMCHGKVRVDKCFLMISHNDGVYAVESCDPMELADCIAYSNEYEQLHFLEYYKAFRFAFPHLQNEFLDQFNQRQRQLLRQALQEKEAYTVRHPYPMTFDKLFHSMEPWCRGPEVPGQSTASDCQQRRA